MFRIECFVEDRKLAELLRGLTGKVVGVPAVIPVANAEPTREGPRAVAENGVGLFIKEMRRRKMDTINAAGAKVLLEKVGLSPTSYNHFLRKAINLKILVSKGTGKGMVYHMTKGEK